MKKLTTLSFSVVLLTSCATAYGWQSYQLKRIKKKSAKLKSFEGRLVQTGLIGSGDAVTTDVIYMAPNKFVAKVATPPPWTGTTVSYDGDAMLFYYPSYRFAIRFTNLPVDDTKADDRLAYRYWYNLKKFDYELRSASRVAKLPVIAMKHRRKSKSTINKGGLTKVYDKYGLAVAGSSVFKGGAAYGYKYETLEVNTNVDEQWFDVKLPPGTAVAEWNLAGPDLSGKKLQTNFEIRWPDDNDVKMARTRVVQAPGIVPAFGAVYQREAFFAFVTATPDVGQVDYGVPVEGGRLILGPEISSFNFAKNGTRYGVVGNVPYEELVALARPILGD